MAPPRKPVDSAQNLALKALEKASLTYIRKATDTLLLGENQKLEECIGDFRAYLFHSIPR